MKNKTLKNIEKNEIKETDRKSVPAAACPICGGWTSCGGMGYWANSNVPVDGRIGCTCHRINK